MSVLVVPAFANVTASTTDAVVVSAVAGAKIRVVKVLAMAAATATNLTFNSKLGSTAGVAISATFPCGINGGFCAPSPPANCRADVQPSDVDFWFETVAGQALTATTGPGSTVAIQLSYVLV